MNLEKIVSALNLEKIVAALQKGELEEVKALIKSSQEGPQKINIHQRDESGVTLLCRAVQLGHEDIVRILVDSGADLSATNHVIGAGGTSIWMPALHICLWGHIQAEKHGEATSHKRIMQFLVDRGVRVHQQDSQGKTAAARAVEWGDPKIAEDLKSMELAKKEKEVLTEAILQITSKKDIESHEVEVTDALDAPAMAGMPSNNDQTLHGKTMINTSKNQQTDQNTSPSARRSL